MLISPALQLSAMLILIGTESDYPRDPLYNPKCGVVEKLASSRQKRIVGGYGALSGAWPWQIAVLDRQKRLLCGGTLISNEFVLTAAHCVIKNMQIVAGEYNLVEKEEFEQERKVKRYFKHPDYDMVNVDNDIALLQLESPLELTQRVWPACLPEKSEELEPEVMATILGWGAIAFHRKPDGNAQVETDDMLYQASVPVVDFAECKNSYGERLERHHVICAGYKEGRIDSCSGDSGGPLLVEREGKWTVYGVTSFGEECGKKGKYGVYSKTSAYVDWIRKIVARHTRSKTSI